MASLQGRCEMGVKANKVKKTKEEMEEDGKTAPADVLSSPQTFLYHRGKRMSSVVHTTTATFIQAYLILERRNYF